MVSGIGSIGSSLGINSIQQALTAQTRAQLQALGINTKNITTEIQGQAALQAAQNSQQTQSTQGTQESQKSQSSAGSNNSEIQAIEKQAKALASQLGVSVSQNAKLDDIMNAISQTLSSMHAQAANDPQKIAEVAGYQAQFNAISQVLTDIQSSMQASSSQNASQMQASMSGLALYNMVSVNMTNTSVTNDSTSNNKLKHQF